MSVSPKVIAGPQPLTAVAAVVGVVVPANGQQIVSRAVFSNTDTNPRTIQVFVSRAGTGTTAATEIIPLQSISGQKTYIAAELTGLVLDGGDAIYAICDLANKVNVTVSGWTTI